ncbi:MAG: alkylmercury lyase family protein [Nitrospirae bacterium]|nr:alkylmercury lyase family protein [Nitrospirota bacterium]
MDIPRPTRTPLEISIGPGVTFPDWSAITSEAARRALAAILAAFDAERCWTGMGEAEDRVRRAVLDGYADRGRAPSVEHLAADLPLDEVRRLLRQLEGRDLVVLDAHGDVTGAYPFRDRETGHRVRLGGQVLNAMCAIDALGAGAMYRTDTAIDSACATCGAAVHVTTRDRGATLEAVAPEGAVVWAGARNTGGCAADTLCPALAFFCSDEHLVSWRQSQPGGAPGVRLSIDEGLQVGKAIFAPLLAPLSTLASNPRRTSR